MSVDVRGVFRMPGPAVHSWSFSYRRDVSLDSKEAEAGLDKDVFQKGNPDIAKGLLPLLKSSP